jgi:hypothetical protein
VDIRRYRPAVIAAVEVGGNITNIPIADDDVAGERPVDRPRPVAVRFGVWIQRGCTGCSVNSTGKVW